MTTFDVKACMERLSPWIIRTPLVEVEALSRRTGKKVYLKLESAQRTGAFKFRGALNYTLTLKREQAEKGIITASSGNHGLGMALGGQLVGVKCTVVMPETAPQVKRERAKGYGAALVVYGSCYDEAQEYARQLALSRGSTYVPSFNHPAIIEGQGTIMGEILADLPNADMVVSPIGGGGLIAGLLLAGEQLQAKSKIVGVEPAEAACMKAAVEAGKLVTLPNMHTVADGVAVRTAGSINLEIVRRLSPLLLSVSDEEILNAQALLLAESKLIAEPAGAVAVAGLLSMQLPPEVERVVCIVTGSNLDLSSLRELIRPLV